MRFLNAFFGGHHFTVSLSFLSDLAPHDVDFINHMFGDVPEVVQGYGTTFDPKLEAVNVIDTALMVLKYPCGAIVTLEMSRSASYGYDQRMEVFGTEGMVTVRHSLKLI